MYILVHVSPRSCTQIKLI